jgi:sorting nexin-4
MEHAQDFDDGRLECIVSSPRKENEGSKDAYVSYLITTKTNFKSFQVNSAPHCL